MTDPAAVGERVLQMLADGRAAHLKARRQRATELSDLVLRAARLDRAAGKPDRGRAGRIARRLQSAGVTVSERHMRNILSELSGPQFHMSDVESAPMLLEQSNNEDRR